MSIPHTVNIRHQPAKRNTRHTPKSKIIRRIMLDAIDRDRSQSPLIMQMTDDTSVDDTNSTHCDGLCEERNEMMFHRLPLDTAVSDIGFILFGALLEHGASAFSTSKHICLVDTHTAGSCCGFFIAVAAAVRGEDIAKFLTQAIDGCFGAGTIGCLWFFRGVITKYAS